MTTLLLLLYLLLLQWRSTAPLYLVGGDVKNQSDQYQRSLLVSLSNRRFQRDAMQAWSRTLTAKDYDNEHWPKLLGM